jgi:predicted RNase H-like HicB family nuclease
MQTAKYVYWQEDGFWFGYLEEFPDYRTQGETLDDLIEHLKDLYVDMLSGRIPGIRRVGELILS